MPSLLAGLLSAIYMQTVVGWWMNSGRGVAYTDAVFLGLAVVCGCLGGRSTLLVRLAALWVGAQIGLVAVLFWIGPGTIWPLTILMGGIVSGVAMLVGGGVGWFCAPLR